jgi:hypothetical protein
MNAIGHSSIASLGNKPVEAPEVVLDRENLDPAEVAAAFGQLCQLASFS